MKRLLLILASVVPLEAQTAVTLNGSGTGRQFDGIGSVSAGGPTRLLLDYKEPYRSQILDYLYKPNYGASLQHLKIEMGSDAEAGGAEPSHERANGVINCNRGYEWWFAQQAKARNPSIIMDSLMWGSAGWVGTFFSASNVTYAVDFLTCAVANGVTMDYTGVWNETYAAGEYAWIKSLYTAIAAAGLTTKIVADDHTGFAQWDITPTLNSDSVLNTDVAVISAHYPDCITPTNCPDSTTKAKTQPLWDSEEGHWKSLSQTGQPNWAGAQYDAETINQNYITGLITRTEMWPPVTSYYSINALPNAGLMLADSPWSGNYTVQPPLWAVAHTTQFIQPGWHYINSACGLLNNGNWGSFVTAKAPNNTDYSIVITTRGATGSQTFNFTITNGLSTGVLHVWRSNVSTQFIQQSDITPSGAAFSITVAADSIYSLTTTTGQAKGSAIGASASTFPMPYNDQFECPPLGASPQYFTDQEGAFEIAACTNGHSGNCLRQVVTTAPVGWPAGTRQTQPVTIMGNGAATNYQWQTDFQIETSGTAVGYIRVSGASNGDVQGYGFRIDQTGAWTLGAGKACSGGCFSSGTASGISANTWHTLMMSANGTTIKATVDGTLLTTVTATNYSTGMIGLATGGFTNVQFDNFRIDPLGDTSAGWIACIPLSSVLNGKFVLTGGKIQ